MKGDFMLLSLSSLAENESKKSSSLYKEILRKFVLPRMDRFQIKNSEKVKKLSEIPLVPSLICNATDFFFKQKKILTPVHESEMVAWGYQVYWEEIYSIIHVAKKEKALYIIQLNLRSIIWESFHYLCPQKHAWKLIK